MEWYVLIIFWIVCFFVGFVIGGLFSKLMDLPRTKEERREDFGKKYLSGRYSG